MIELGIRIEKLDNPAGYPVAWIWNERGVVRRASKEEEQLWDALQAALERQERHAKKVKG